MNKGNDLEEFLKILENQKDVGLVVAQNESGLNDFEKFFRNNGFQTSKNIFDFFDFQKIYFVLDENLEKDFYDFIVQYPTGQVEIFNKEKMESKIFLPDYENQTIVLAGTEDGLAKLKQKGFEIINMVGPVYRS